MGETMQPENNLLVELYRWTWRLDENFTTDASAHLLRHLLAEERQLLAWNCSRPLG